MALLASALISHTAHRPGLRSHIGTNGDNLSWHEKSKRRCDLNRVRSLPWSGELVEYLTPSEIPKRDWFSDEFVFGSATSAYQVLFLAARIMYMSSVLLIISKISLSFTMITNIEREILMSECMLSSNNGLFDAHKKIFYIVIYVD